MKKFFTLIFTLFACVSMEAQVVINEYSASNLNGANNPTYTDEYGKTEDWIELYNTSNTAVDLSGWHVSDKESKPTKWVIPNGVTIGANDFLVVYCSGRDKYFRGELHSNFKLSQTKGQETLILSDPQGVVTQSIPYETTLITSIFLDTPFNKRFVMTEPSRCRVTDGSDEWKICTATSLGQSNNNSPMYDRYTVAPTIELEAGFYQGEQVISITNNEPNSILRYTTDATNPLPSSLEYTGPITMTETGVLKVQAYSNDNSILSGKMDFATFLIDENHTLPVFSIAADGVTDLANDDDNIPNTREFKPVGSLEYFDATGERTATSFGTLNRHGQDSWALDHRSIDWVSRDEMGYNKAIPTELFEYSDRDEFQRIILRASGDDNYPALQGGQRSPQHEGSAHIRDEYVHQLAQTGNMKVDVRAVERVVVYFNGQYWGVYGLRERPVDHDYVKEYYGHDKKDIQFLSTWDRTEAEYGGYTALYEWLEFRNFILNNDMSIPENYQRVKDEMQVLSLMDYMIANLNSVASDWLNYNTGWWRGIDPDGDHKKWGYILWDNDATFDYYINYSGVPNTDPDAVPCDVEDIIDFVDGFLGGVNSLPFNDPNNCTTTTNGSSPYGADDPIFNRVVNEIQSCCSANWGTACQTRYEEIEIEGTNTSEFLSVNGNIGGHGLIFEKLQEESPEFRQLYYSRQADLMNTIYSCESMLTILDNMVAEIAPEMPQQIARWGGNMDEWQENITQLREFVEERCELIDEGIQCFENGLLTGPFDLTLNTFPEGVGEIDLNTLDLREFPWTGRYFGEMDNLIKARAFDEDTYFFSHWETANGSVIEDENAFRTSMRLTQDEVLTAVFTTEVSTLETESGHTFEVFPNPATDHIVLDFELAKNSNLKVSIYNTLGSKVADITSLTGQKSAGRHTEKINLGGLGLTSGMHMVEVLADNDKAVFRVMISK